MASMALVPRAVLGTGSCTAITTAGLHQHLKIDIPPVVRTAATTTVGTPTVIALLRLRHGRPLGQSREGGVQATTIGEQDPRPEDEVLPAVRPGRIGQTGVRLLLATNAAIHAARHTMDSAFILEVPRAPQPAPDVVRGSRRVSSPAVATLVRTLEPTTGVVVA